MELDKKIVERSVKMGLISRLAAERVLAPTLDAYMLEMHSEKVAAVLESFTSFARRIVPLSQRDPDAPCWRISDDILVQRRHWIALTRLVKELVSIIMDCLESDRTRRRANLQGQIMLRAAAREAAWIYTRKL